MLLEKTILAVRIANNIRAIKYALLLSTYILFVHSPMVRAAALTADLEVHLLTGVSTSWQTVPLENTYSNAIPICTYNLVSFAGSAPNYSYPPVAVRIRNITSTSFDLRIQGWEDSSAATGDVHCIVSDEGVFTLPNGTSYEAHTVVSDQTSGQNTPDGRWSQAILEDVTSSIVQTYTNHVVLGQVISYNDNRASVFYTTDCDARDLEPFNGGHADGICVGKHIGMVPGSRNPETIGYLVAEAGSGTVNNIDFELDRGADTVGGNTAANVGYSYTLSGDYSIGVNAQVAEDGGNGSWSVLYGTDPLPPNQIISAVDEEIIAGDTSRGHTREIVDYWVFATAEITLLKQVINNEGGTSVVSDFTLAATGPSTISGVSGTPAVTDASVAPGTYTLAETGPANYTGTWRCNAGILTGSSLTITAGEHAVCTLVNDDIFFPPEAFLTLQKKVVNDHGGSAVTTDFKLGFNDGAGVSGSGIQGDAPITLASIPPGLYDLDETMLAGYTLVEISCDGLDPDGLDGLKIAAGEKVTCTFVNDDKGVDLKVKKSVSNNTPNVGDVLTFSIDVANNGPDTATNVRVTDVVKSGFIYIGASMTGGDIMIDTSPAGSGLDWEVVSLPAGASVTLTFQATVSAP